MADPIDYRERISQYNQEGLLELWTAVEAGLVAGWPPGKAFEYLILRAFELEGAEVRWPYTVNFGQEIVEQIDGAVYWNGLACLIECKDTEEKASIEPLAKMRNQLLRRPGATIGVIFSRRGFTDPAIILARFMVPQTLLLWSGREVAYALTKRAMCQALVLKYRYCVEYGLPDYNIATEDAP